MLSTAPQPDVCVSPSGLSTLSTLPCDSPAKHSSATLCAVPGEDAGEPITPITTGTTVAHEEPVPLKKEPTLAGAENVEPNATQKPCSCACHCGSQPRPSTPAKPQPSPVLDEKPQTSTEKKHPLALNPDKSWREWGSENLGGEQMLYILLTQAFSAGLLDAFAYGDFETFASNQTGNMILLTLAAIGTVPVQLLLTGVSLAAFMLAAFMFGHIANWWGARKRSWLLVTTGLQLIVTFLAMILASPVAPNSTRVHGKHEWVVLFLVAFMSGQQVAAARQSKCAEVPTAPMTSPLVELLIDSSLFGGNTRARNRRAAYIGLVITGSFIGAALHRWANSWSIVVCSVGVKVFVMGLICWLKPHHE